MEKRDDEALKEIFKRSDELEKMYNEMSKESIVNMLVFRQMMDEAFDVDEENHEVELWFYVSDKTGAKYLSDAYPKKYTHVGGGDWAYVDAESYWISSGEVEIRVPTSLAGLFPDLKYGDEPVRVKLSVSF